MAEDDTKTRVHKDIQERVLRGLGDSKPAVLALNHASAKLEHAIKKGGVDPDVLATYRRELEAKMRGVGRYALDAAAALGELKRIADDEDDFEADSDEIEAVQERLTKLKAALSDMVVKAKKLDDRAKNSVQDGEKSEKAAQREWAMLIDLYDSIGVATASNIKMFRAEFQKALDAYKARDAAGLAEHRGMVLAHPIMDDTLQGKEVAKKANLFLSKYDIGTFSKGFVTQIAKDRATTIADLDKKLQTLESEIKKMQDEVAKLEVPPPDYVKITAKLGFKANFNARVEKALKLDEAKFMKELEAIGKDAGVKGTGKDFVAKLKKEGLYP